MVLIKTIKIINFILIFSIYLGALCQGEDTYTQVSATDVLKKIENNEGISYDHVIIIGSLDSARLNLSESENGERIINVPIFISNSTINDNVSFYNIIFHKPVYFRNTTFKGHSDFRYSIFSNGADFRLSKFDKDANFLYSIFKGDAFFLSTIFVQDANFWETYFENDVDFGSARFERNAIISFATFNGYGFFNNCTFLKKIDLYETKFSKLEIRFETIKNHLNYNENIYEKLVENYKSLGWYHDSNECYFYYRDEKQRNAELGWAKLTDIIAWLSCGYGVRPSYTIGMSLVLVMLFGLLYWLGNGINRSDACDRGKDKVLVRNTIKEFGRSANNIGSKCRKTLMTKISLNDAFYYSAIVFISQPHPNWHPKRKWRYLVLIEDILGWLMLALFIATLGKVMIR